VKNKFNIIFLGTPEFAVPSLKALHANGHRISLVVTQPDRPKGRGRKLSPPPVKTAASALGLDVIQPESLRTSDFESRVIRYKPHFLVVVAFGKILTERNLSLPRIGTINVHASLLPKYRGPAPINWAIINGDTETGVTTMLMDKELDTGDILMMSKEPITPSDTAASLHDRLALAGSELLIKTLEAFAAQHIHPVAQNGRLATYAPLLKKEDGHIDWKRSAEFLERFIRGVTPWPGAYTFYGDNRLKIFKAQPVSRLAAAPPGTVLEGFADELLIATGKGALSLHEIQGPSGKRLPISEFLRGCQIPPGKILR
jgi:methionyl-tRNA formyltransferase